MKYLESLQNTIIDANRQAFNYAKKTRNASDAWDNVKKKNNKKFAPRGNAYKKLERMESGRTYVRLMCDAKNRLGIAMASGML